MKRTIRFTCALALLAGACELTATTDDDEEQDERTGSAVGARDAGPRGVPAPVEAGAIVPDAAPAPTPDAGSPDSGVPPASDTPVSAFPMTHSNLPADVVLSKQRALTIAHGVGIDTDTLKFTGVYADEGAPLQLVTTPDGELAVLFVESLTTTTAGGINATGQRPLVIVSASTIDHAGWITSVASGSNGYAAGGAPGSSTPERKGFGPGGGAAGNATTGGSGGSFCGLGGVPLGGVPTPPYGNPSLKPLLGGSAGGSSTGGNNAAGGAVQLVALESIVIKETGGINVPGRGTTAFAGGSSGGAILLEAPKVSVLGVLAANGASGGGNIWEGFTGTITNTPIAAHDQGNGAGSAGTQVNGGNGATLRASGGGGVGRIRINGATITLGANAVITPNKGTPCYSEGTL